MPDRPTSFRARSAYWILIVAFRVDVNFTRKKSMRLGSDGAGFGKIFLAVSRDAKPSV
jgi:hypothetical protein